MIGDAIPQRVLDAWAEDDAQVLPAPEEPDDEEEVDEETEDPDYDYEDVEEDVGA